MARDIAELGADVIDDTPVDPKHKMSKKKRNYIIGLSIATAFLAGAVTATVILCNTALSDYSNVEKVMYYITPLSELKEGEKPGAVLYKLDSSYKYKSTFRIPSTVKGYKVIGVADEAFSGHSEIKKIVMPNSLRFVGDRAFYNCKNLASFTWSKNLVEVGVDAFSNTKFYTDLSKNQSSIYKLPAGMLVYVGDNYFDSNTALISDDLTDAEINAIRTEYGASNVAKFSSLGITGICSGVFKNNSKLVYVDFFKNINVIYDYTFSGCKNLKGVDLSHSDVTELSVGCFKDSTKLKDVKLSSKVKTIGDYAFANTGFKTDIPDLTDVDKFGEYIFADCDELESLTYTGEMVPEYMFSGCTSLTMIEWGMDDSNIDNVYAIESGAFEDTGFITFTLPKNITIINDFSFEGCEDLKQFRLYGNPDFIERTDIDPEEIEYDDDGNPIIPTYIDDEGVEHEGVLKGISTIKAAAFKGCTALDTISLYDDDGLDIPAKTVEGQYFFPYSLKRTDVNATIAGKNNHTFSQNKVQKVTITPNQTTIGSFAFFGVDTLTEVEFEQFDKSRLTTVNEAAFENCTNLPSIALPSTVNSIKPSAFKGCTNLVNVDIKNTSIKSLSAETFYECNSLAHVDLPSTITVIKKESFYRNYNLDYILIPSSITSIERGCVKECRTGDEKIHIYIDLTYAEVVTNAAPYNENLFDEHCEIYYRLGATEQKVEGRHYWQYDSDHKPEVIPNP